MKWRPSSGIKPAFSMDRLQGRFLITAITVAALLVIGGASVYAATSLTQTNATYTTTSPSELTGGFNTLYTATSSTDVYGTGESADVRLTSSYPWVTATVDSTGLTGFFTSIAVDTNGKAYISYYDDTPEHLKYATNVSGAWVIATVDSTAEVGQYTSIAVDTNGKAYISYWDETNSNLKYATNVSGSWVTETVDSTGFVGEYTSIAVDTNGKAYISYRDSNDYDLKYATNASGAWVTATVDSSPNLVGYYTSIALDTNGKAYISYYDNTDSDLKYATNVSGAWVTATVDSTGDVGSNTSIDVDTSGKAYISYYDGTNGDLKYATNVSGAWVTAAVDSTNFVGRYTSIALDTSGKAYISYYYSSSDDLKYATNSEIAYASSGTYKSYVDGGVATPNWSTFTATKGSTASGAGSIAVKIKTSSSSTTPPTFDATGAACDFTISSDGSSGSKDLTTCTSLGTAQYLWYEATLTTADTSKSPLLQDVTAIINVTPSDPTTLGPTASVNGSTSNDTTPDLTFTLTDTDGADTVRYQVQIDDTSNFASPVIDYISVLAAQGVRTFMVGQSAGAGTYVTGAEAQILSAASYYWRVRSGDNAFATSSYATANSGLVAFVVAETVTSGSYVYPTPQRWTIPDVLRVSLTPTLPPAVCFVFINDLEYGMTSKAVRKLQQFLNTHGYAVSASGIGSLGNETYYFGRATERALARFQKAYAAELLAPEGLTKGNGKLKSKTRKKANQFFVNACAQTSTPIPSVSDPLVPLPEADLPAEPPHNQPPDWFIDDTETNRPPIEDLAPSSSTVGEDSVQLPAIDNAEDGPRFDSPKDNEKDILNPPPEPKGPSEVSGPPYPRAGFPSSLVNSVFSQIQAVAEAAQNVVFEQVAPIAVPVGLTVAVGALVATTIPSTNNPSLARLWHILLSALGLRKRKPWGVVYDSVTKHPIDPATIVLTDEFGTPVHTSYTDLEGRYGFLAKPGTYRLEVKKTNYIFPSERLRGRTSDEVYDNLYFGGTLSVTEEGALLRNIPLDPTNLDWAEFAKQSSKTYYFYSNTTRISSLLATWLFRLGFLAAIYFLYTSFSIYYVAIVAVYALVGALRLLGFGPRPYGYLTDKETGAPLAFALVTVKDALTKQEVARTVTDHLGRYYALVPNGEYVVQVSRKEEEEYTKIFTSEAVHVRRGVLRERVRVVI